MAKRKRPSRKRRSPARRAARSLVFALLGVALLGIGGLKWAGSAPGQRLLADRGVASAREAMVRRIDEGIVSRLLAAGVSDEAIAREPAQNDGPVTLAVETRASLLDLNIAITEGVSAAGGLVHHGRRIEHDRSTTLELHIGTERIFTHRVLLHRGEERVEPPPLPRGRLALVIDDWGHNLGAVARRILAVPQPLTLAILPELPYSRRVLTEAGRRGKRALLHLPMEPDVAGELPADDPAVRVGMDADQIRELTGRLLDGLRGVDGVNNHMGSRATRYRPEMEAVVGVLAERGLLFLDSVTTRKSVAYQVAREMGVPTLRNDLFLDNDTEDPAVVEARLRRLVQMAREQGRAVGIGHVNPATAHALETVLPELDPADVQLVFLEDLAHTPPPEI